jgi:putative FmdB family regulatory protein
LIFLGNKNMPIYEYQCPKCGIVEIIQKFSDPELERYSDCAQCHGDCKIKKVISASAFHLKGSGWYKTDYSKNSSSSQGAVKSNASNDSASGSGVSSETNSGGDKKSEPAKAGSCRTGCGCH